MDNLEKIISVQGDQGDQMNNVKIDVCPDEMEKITVSLMEDSSEQEKPEKPFVINSDKMGAKKDKSPLFRTDDEMIWSIFKILMDSHSSPLVRHQVDSFDEFLSNDESFL